MNCREGDMALIIGPHGSPDVGQQVKCEKLFASGSHLLRLEFPSGTVHMTARLPTWRLDRAVWVGMPRLATVALGVREVWAPFKADRYLMPIRPEPDPEEIPAEREVTA